MAILFFSYSHVDEALRDRLEVALAMLKNQGDLQTWHDRRIPAGDVVDDIIDAQMERADIILLLVSPEFLASRYCYGIEMRRAMERHEEGRARVIPVILRPCQWHGAPFGKLLALPKDGKPVTKHADLDDAFLEIADGIKAIITKPNARPPHGGQPSPPSVCAVLNVGSSPVRSSNLRLRKTFTQADEDRFLDEAFEFIAKFFEASLAELERRNEEIEARFKRLDPTAFTAVAYRSGMAVAQCRIFLQGRRLGGGIAYSEDTDSRNSFNESIAVVHDDQALGLRPLGYLTYALTGRSEFLTPEGAAELYWAHFMDPLQR